MAAVPVQYTRSGGQWLAYTVTGEGPIVTVFVSAMMSNVEIVEEPIEVRRIYDRLRSLGPLVTFDRRGAGLSDPVPGLTAASADEWSEDLLAVLNAVGAEEVCLFTFDSGSPYALLFAAAHPERVRSIALIEPLIPYLTSSGGGSPEVELFGALIESGWGSGVILPTFSPRTASDPAAAAWWARFERLSMGRQAAAQAISDYTHFDVRTILGAVQASVLVVRGQGGDQARAAINPDADPLQEALEHCTVVEIDHTDLHWWWDHQLANVMLDAVLTHFTGRPVEPDADRVLATVLFTDIVDSTVRAAELGDRRWTQLLAAHDEIVDREVQAHGGTVVKSTGDGCLATFAGPARAVRCAATIRQALRPLGIDLRAGLHTGEIERRGGDIAGMAVNVAARIMGIASDGEVLVSRTVRDLVVGSGLEFGDRGEHELKGVPERWTVLALTSPTRSRLA